MRLETITTAEGRALGLLYALPGALAGLALWLVLEWAMLPTRAEAASSVAIIYGVGAWALATEPGARRRALIFSAALGAGLGLLSWLAFGRFGDESWFQILVAPPALGWVALSFYRVGPRDYPGLFAAAWNLPVVLAVSLTFAGGAYGLLWLLAAMFDLIGLPLLTDALGEGIVSFPVIGALTASGIAVVRRQESILASLRTVLFGLLRVLAPVFALGTALFSIALVFQGLDTLWNGWSPVVLLVSTLAAGAVFINAVVQDGDAPEGFLALVARVQALVLPVLAGLAAYGMVVRIGDHGLTPMRIVASLIAGFAAAYAVSYAGAGATGRWGWLRRANVVLALALSGTLAFTMTPLFRAQEWSVAHQVSRLERGAVSVEDFDYAALRFEMGEPGRRALERLAAGNGEEAVRAKAALDAEYRFQLLPDGEDEMAPRLAYLDAGQVRPEGTVLPTALKAELQSRLYGTDLEEPDADEIFLMMPDYQQGRDALLWVRRRPGEAFVSMELWIEAGTDAPAGSRDWWLRETYGEAFESLPAADAFIANARQGSFGPAPVEVTVPFIAGRPILPDDDRFADIGIHVEHAVPPAPEPMAPEPPAPSP